VVGEDVQLERHLLSGEQVVAGGQVVLEQLPFACDVAGEAIPVSGERRAIGQGGHGLLLGWRVG